MRECYVEQVRLLMRLLPVIAAEIVMFGTVRSTLRAGASNTRIFDFDVYAMR